MIYCRTVCTVPVPVLVQYYGSTYFLRGLRLPGSLGVPNLLYCTVGTALRINTYCSITHTKSYSKICLCTTYVRTLLYTEHGESKPLLLLLLMMMPPVARCRGFVETTTTDGTVPGASGTFHIYSRIKYTKCFYFRMLLVPCWYPNSTVMEYESIRTYNNCIRRMRKQALFYFLVRVG